jgi:YggT family protein
VTGGYFTEALVFLIGTLFGLYLVVVALRFLLQCVRADFYNPVSQFLVTVTNPPLRLLRRFVPGYAGIDLSAVVLMFALKVTEIALIGLIAIGRLPAPAGLAVLACAELLELAVYIFIFAVLVQVVISWVNPGAYNHVTVILYRLTEPLLRPARRLVPPISGLDLSPIVVLIGLQMIIILVVKPLSHLARMLS